VVLVEISGRGMSPKECGILAVAAQVIHRLDRQYSVDKSASKPV
jgi:hypothetical protein